MPYVHVMKHSWTALFRKYKAYIPYVLSALIMLYRAFMYYFGKPKAVVLSRDGVKK